MSFKSFYYDSVVIGTGAAGYNAAARIKQMGKRSVAIITENVLCGTSRNTGSDKQTYYKLGLGGSNADSVRQMAADLYAGGSVDGDNALCEAALSGRCFLNLAELGVEFPTNRYGEYVGYKTDHDPYARATSAGPLTSKFMTEALQKNCEKLDVTVHNNLLAVEILKDNNGVVGLVCLEKETGEFTVFYCPNVVLATGGPAGIYADSVYPQGHTGTTSLAILAGAHLQNMTEWQYGLASIAPRWNVSGTYMQVLPRLVSVDADGNEYEFLTEYYSDIYDALSMVFLKGYQWPFDSRKAQTGSSIVDLLVYRECVLRGRRVYLDYTKNPFGLDEIDYKKLSAEAYEYLYKAEACFGTPIERLLKMNSPAVDLYSSKGLDITKEYLEIALCAQHNNGGIAVDLWWQTAIKGLFAVGECAGTHGISRPGGSALNAGQVGSLRAAQYISETPLRALPEKEALEKLADAVVEKHVALVKAARANENNVIEKIKKAQRRMSDCGAAIRNPENMEKALGEILSEIKTLSSDVGVDSVGGLYRVYKLLDVLYVQALALAAMLDFTKTVGATRGSALYYNAEGEKGEGLEEQFRFISGGTVFGDKVQEVYLDGETPNAFWRDARPLPADDDFFENVWRRYREDKNVY